MSISKDLFNIAVNICNYVGITPPSLPSGLGKSIHFIEEAFTHFPPGGFSNLNSSKVLASMFMHGDAGLSNIGFNANFGASLAHPSPGDYTITFAAPLSNVKYSFFITSASGALIARFGNAGFATNGSGANKTTSLNYKVLNAENVGTNEDHWITIIDTSA